MNVFVLCLLNSNPGVYIKNFDQIIPLQFVRFQSSFKKCPVKLRSTFNKINLDPTLLVFTKNARKKDYMLKNFDHINKIFNLYVPHTPHGENQTVLSKHKTLNSSFWHNVYLQYSKYK